MSKLWEEKLPKIDLPIYEIQLPSNSKKIKIRPFIVREEKLLLMAIESQDDMEIINTTKQIINNCIIDSTINIESLPFFDVDYLFIALRAKSVGESIEIKFTCNNVVNDQICNTVFPAKIDIANVSIVKDDSISNMIDLGKGACIKMKYPNYTTMKMILDNDNIMNKQINIIAGSIEQIVNGQNVYTTKDLTKEEIINFIEGLTKEQYSKLENFINNLPSFEVNSVATCSKCGFEHNLTYSDFTSFFV